MTRWNPCCCDQVVILPKDMVLVRAGWYHFMVMTKDGKINVFADAGVRSDGIVEGGDPRYFYINGNITRNTVGPDGKQFIRNGNLIGVTSCWSLTDHSIKKLNSDEDLDPLGWLLRHNGDNTNERFHPYFTPAEEEGGISYFGMSTLYPEACNGYPWFPCSNKSLQIDITDTDSISPRNIPGDFCSESLGACCGKNKTCKLTNPNNCDGYFQGIGTKCIDEETGELTGICEVPGACCVAGENNQFAPVIRNALQCVGYTLGSTADGVTMTKTTFFGNGTNFSMGFSCSPRIEITGACCTKDRGCVVTSQEKCNGYFQGKGTTCGQTGMICDIPGLCCVSDNTGKWEQFISSARDCVGYTFTNAFLDPRLGITCSSSTSNCGFTVINKTFFGNNTDFNLNVNCSTNKFIGADLCPYYELEGLIGSPGLLDGTSSLWPHGYFEFNGDGCAISRPPKTIRHNSLILTRGLSGQAGITRSVLTERYQPMAKPVNSFHPLSIPEDLKRRLDTGERRVIDIECGAYHNIVRLDDNSIVCWGLNSMGQCNVPDELKPDWSRPNGQIQITETSISGRFEDLVISLDNPLLEIKDTRGTRGGVGAKIRLKTTKIGTNNLVVGVQVIDPGYGYLQNTVKLKIPGIEPNNNNIISKIKFTVIETTVPHIKKPKICSIHAGFSNTAVLFNDGTALCWGDPEIANQINQWENIRISPIKRKPVSFDGNAKSCNGVDSEGFPDGDKPQFPANKYNNGTFNINTDWYELWRLGTPVYPHFDLGIETGTIYPVNHFYTQDASYSIPGYWCSDCNNPYEHKIIKDFAVGMLRSGQIVTTRKVNAPSSGKNRLYSRDCNIDANYVNNSGFVNPPDIGPVIVDTTVLDTTGSREGESLNCRDIAASVFPLNGLPYTKCSSYACSAYNNLSLKTDQDGNIIYNKPEGIGCYTSLSEGENGVLYDPNWAIGNIYTPGQQVRPQGFTGGRWPVWNRGDVSYGWETKVAVGSRNRPGSQQYLNLIGFPQCVTPDAFVVPKCIMRLGDSQPCDEFCPSDPNFKWKDSFGNTVDYFSGGKGNEGVPGYFRYPIHIATALTCIAGTNTVNWIHSAKLLPIKNSTILSKPSFSLVKAETDLWENGCEKHHGDYTGCGECDYVGGNNERHNEEIGDMRTATIYSKGSDNYDRNGVQNPLTEEDPLPRQLYPLSYMMPSRPWGPWQLKLLTGTATPPKLDMNICSYNLIRGGCAHMSIEKVGEVPLFDNYIAENNFTPSWFTGHCEGAVSFGSDAFNQKIKFGKIIRPLRRFHVYWPTSTAWQSTDAGYNFGGIDCNDLPECNPQSPFFIPGPNGEVCGTGKFVPAKSLEEGVDPRIELNCKNSGIPCNGDMPPSLFKLCYGIEDDELKQGKRVLFPPAIDAPICRGSKGTYEFCGITGCDMALFDKCNKWCFDNPTLSYATGRSFAIFIRRSPWERGLTGEFIWQKHCSKTDADYSFTQFDPAEGYGRDFDGIKGTKLWLTGSLYDPCPPWPRRCDIDENCEGLTGLTCGTYPTWVPVPDVNKSSQKDKNHYASKGYWEYESVNYVNTKKYSETNWIFQDSCEKYYNLSIFANEEIKERFKPLGRSLIDIFKEYIGYGEEDGKRNL